MDIALKRVKTTMERETTPPLKSRIAPTPSGFLHLGNVYSFVLTWLMVKKRKGALWLRIDDLDQDRFRPEYLEDIFRVLELLGIEPDEGPSGVADFQQNHSQTHRMPLYEKLLEQLAEQQAVFTCNCSRKLVREFAFDDGYPETCADKGMRLDKPNCVWRLHTEVLAEVQYQELNQEWATQRLPTKMRAFVIRKKDKLPAYQLTSLADDLQHGVNFVVRGKDLEASTQAQVYLANVLGLEEWKATCFFHHQLLKDAKGHKLSKSAGSQAKPLSAQGLNERANLLNALSGMPFIPRGKYKSLHEMLEAFEGIA